MSEFSRTRRLLGDAVRGRGPASDGTPEQKEWALKNKTADVLREFHKRKAASHASFQHIPLFYRKPTMAGAKAAPGAPSEERERRKEVSETTLRHKLKAFARSRFLQRREARLLESEEVEEVEQLLAAVRSGPRGAGGGEGEEEPRINYDDFSQLEKEVPPSARRFFSVAHFLQCPRDRHGRIGVADFVRHLNMALSLEKTKVTLHFYDTEGAGFLREQDLEQYMFDLITTMPALGAMPESFYPYYCFTTVRRFMFFLDPKRTGKVSIEAMVRSRVMGELMELAHLGGEDGSPTRGQEGSRGPVGEAALKQRRGRNWFSFENAMRVYNMYLELDDDHDGLLSKDELIHYGSSTSSMRLTGAFINRVFEESITYRMEDGAAAEMDFKVFIDFVIAMESKSTPQGLKWFFRMLDVRHEGAISAFSVRYLFKEVAARVHEFSFDAPKIDDVKDEIFDMARPKDIERGITFHDLQKCGVGHHIISMLIDVNGFLMYDNRESVLSTPEDSEPS